MVTTLRQSLIPSLPLLVGAGAGLVVALAAVLMPGGWLDAAVDASGIAALLPAATPPLGATARAVLALGGGSAVGAVAWAAAYLLVGPGGPLAPRGHRTEGVPQVRRADAHPDAPPRRPLSTAELTEQPLPADLDVPLAAFDPDALLPVPREPARPVAPLAPAPALAPGERLETFAITPPVAPPIAVTGEKPSIDALLRRLEQGALRRAAPAR